MHRSCMSRFSVLGSRCLLKIALCQILLQLPASVNSGWTCRGRLCRDEQSRKLNAKWHWIRTDSNTQKVWSAFCFQNHYHNGKKLYSEKGWQCILWENYNLNESLINYPRPSQWIVINTHLHYVSFPVTHILWCTAHL